MQGSGRGTGERLDAAGECFRLPKIFLDTRSAPRHDMNHMACFNPQPPRYFVEWLTVPGDAVHAPFAGRGTTAEQAALLVRLPIPNDVDPL